MPRTKAKQRNRKKGREGQTNRKILLYTINLQDKQDLALFKVCSEFVRRITPMRGSLLHEYGHIVPEFYNV